VKRFGIDVLITLTMAAFCILIVGEDIMSVAKEFVAMWIIWICIGAVVLTWIGLCLHRAMNPQIKKEENDDPPVHQ
jgi:hypothetical protein